MSSAMKIGGLCSTCVGAETCTYPRDLSRPVLQCEEFEGIEAGPRRNHDVAISVPVHARVSTRVEADTAGPIMGLCSNCECRETCVYPKREGGVWRCEEYM